jgi:hypothetical protein
MDPWRVLGVPRYSSAEECRRAFQARALKLHPDVNPSPAAARDFQHLREAYEFLKGCGFSAGVAPRQGPSAYGAHPFGAGSGSAADAARMRARAEAFRAMQAAARAAEAEAEAEAMRGGRSGAARAPRASAQLLALHRLLDFVFQPRVLLVAIPLLAYASYTMVSALAAGKGGGGGGGGGRPGAHHGRVAQGGAALGGAHAQGLLS